MKAFALAVALLTLGATPWGAERAAAQAVDSTCLVLWQDSPLCPCATDPSFVWSNPDSARVDMCPGPQYLQVFSKVGYFAHFLYFIIPDSLDPATDTLPHPWQDVDTSYSALRAAFEMLEQRFGSFTLRHEDDWGTTGDWFVSFFHYANVDSAIYYINKLPDLNPNDTGFATGFHYARRYGGFEGVTETKHDTVIMWPQPCSGILYIRGTRSPKSIVIYDILGHRVFPPIMESDGFLTIDFSNLWNGCFYINASGQFSKILIQR